MAKKKQTKRTAKKKVAKTKVVKRKAKKKTGKRTTKKRKPAKKLKKRKKATTTKKKSSSSTKKKKQPSKRTKTTAAKKDAAPALQDTAQQLREILGSQSMEIGPLLAILKVVSDPFGSLAAEHYKQILLDTLHRESDFELCLGESKTLLCVKRVVVPQESAGALAFEAPRPLLSARESTTALIPTREEVFEFLEPRLEGFCMPIKDLQDLLRDVFDPNGGTAITRMEELVRMNKLTKCRESGGNEICLA